MRFCKPTLLASVFCIILSLALVFTKGLNLGIDFSGGTLVEIRVDSKIDIAQIRESLLKIKDFQVQSFNEGSSSNHNDFMIRVAKSELDQTALINEIKDSLNQKFSSVEYRKIDFVGPQVGSELLKKGTFALFLSFLFIMIYIWIRFDWQFGLGGIFALLHDAIITLGFYSITGLQFDLTSIAAILTIIGYSINDSVVIYDRIRENLSNASKSSNLASLINSSINSTLSRTILTSSVTLVSILALILFAGSNLYSFSIATFFGIIIGTYSSIYISAPALIYLDIAKKKKRQNIK